MKSGILALICVCMSNLYPYTQNLYVREVTSHVSHRAGLPSTRKVMRSVGQPEGAPQTPQNCRSPWCLCFPRRAFMAFSSFSGNSGAASAAENPTASTWAQGLQTKG